MDYYFLINKFEHLENLMVANPDLKQIQIRI
jgi:hypothetical protein